MCIRDRIYNKALRILEQIIVSTISEKGITVLLFGSRAKGKAFTTSDIDIGIISRKRNVDKLLALLKEKIENSNIPYKVDVVNLQAVSEKFRRKALEKTKILWKS